MNKQIEEMAKDICRRELEPNCATCYFQDKNCRDLILSEKLYNKGYRKASDVLEEVWESGDVYQMPDGIGLVIRLKNFAELKKKYESEGEE